MHEQKLLSNRLQSTALPFSNDETHVVMAGDWHGNTDWIGKAIPSIARETSGVRTILHAGDFGIWSGVRGRKYLDAIDFWCDRAGIARVLVTPGNHEDWDWLDREFSAQPGKPVELSTTVEVLPRGYRFEIGNRILVSFGGAASVDFDLRKPGIDWFPGELPTEQDVLHAISGGPVDVLLTHETIDGGTPATELVLSNNPMRWSPKALEYSIQSRALVTRVWEEVAPKLLFHGHMHVADATRLVSGQQVVSLGRDGQAKNLALLELSTLDWQWLNGAPKPPGVRRTRDWETQFMTRPKIEEKDG
ncbi:metallophosphoesterase family protein [Microterricola viridarii]|uniref:Calcineurin-like phosphoesterase n=1 Tax=Microterricola viridarii TaxID=412690 RepID=A0A1H1T6F4_9MICO|nr:metallophosphoesterase [Microterricola viridarii]SDS55219.1 Calcineurin-like phosphoesterase [Microterricola viridarii]